MTCFASFRKCDLQVHSPRDPGWRGTRCVGLVDELPDGRIATEDDVKSSRELWARKLIDQCVERELRCIAITDHHEMVMTHYLMRELQLRELTGEPADVWVLPGMELTLEHGCQAIVLFDADLETKWWTQAQSSLGIAVPAIEELAGASKAPVQLAFPYTEIGDRLNEVQELKGRFIVLPNVSEGGQHTVLRNGFHKAFREMTYVGDTSMRVSHSLY